MSSSSDSDHSDSELTIDEEKEQTPASTLVVTKYKAAAEIANGACLKVLAACVAGAKAGALCDAGDTYIEEHCSKVFKAKSKSKEDQVARGTAFPTCVSINNIICHYSPLPDDDIELKDGDMVKVDVGVHIDGYIATLAQTTVVGASANKKCTGRQADVMWAAYNAMECAIRMLRPKKHKNMDVTDAIGKVVDSYKCKPIENMLSHQLLKDKIDGEKQIIQNPGEKQRSDMAKCEFDVHEVYAIDILCSTGEGKARDTDRRTTVYKKSDEIVYQLKMKHSRAFLSEIVKKHGDMPFSLRHVQELAKAKMGVKECVEHGLMKPYPVLEDRAGEYVAQFKCTVLIMPNGLLKITGMPLDASVYSTEHKVEEKSLCELMQTALKPSKKNKKKKKAKSGKENVSAPAAAGKT